MKTENEKRYLVAGLLPIANCQRPTTIDRRPVRLLPPLQHLANSGQRFAVGRCHRQKFESMSQPRSLSDHGAQRQRIGTQGQW